MEERSNTKNGISKDEFLKELEEGKAAAREAAIKEFKEVGQLPNWSNYNASSKFKSVRRAIRRGHVDLLTGWIYPVRPFSNRKVSIGRKLNELKKTVYGQLRASNLI